MADLVYSPPGPVAKRFLESDAFVRVIVGPFGSGKTAAGIVDALRRSWMQAPGPDGVRRVRGSIVRNTFAELKSTTIPSWNQWCPPQYGKLTMGTSPIEFRYTDAEMDLQVFFIPLDGEEDVKKLLSLELTWAMIDEARQIDRAILDALTGRVGRYPSRLQGGCTWSGITMVSNPSDMESWFYKLCANLPEGYELFHQPSGISDAAENLENLPANYYKRQMAGKTEEWIKVYVHGQWGFLQEGAVVYPSFSDSAHVPAQPIPAVPNVPLILGADWGNTPAAAIGQMLPDGTVLTLAELVTAEGETMSIPDFGRALTRFIRQTYPDHEVAAATGDPAGTAKGPSGDTVFDMINANTPWHWKPAGTNELAIRIAAVSELLGRMVNGKPSFVLSSNCPQLRKGFAGGYHFKKVATATGGVYSEEPNKNRYSHPHDALQYMVLGAGGADIVMNRTLRKDRVRARQAADVDYPIFGDDRQAQRNPMQVGVRWGEPSRETYRNERESRPSVARSTDYDIFD
ncbi:hypothetical protein [Burkholderia seminalis]|uniref:hypothetical protein n=1 Tax=Burkholderia seminalis TaxID=488731 RepID=UPI001588F200|nr:hypothetical protein [Burkholderia seminalis]